MISGALICFHFDGIACLCILRIHCLQSPFSTLSPRFIIMARVDDDILDIIDQMLAVIKLITLFDYVCDVFADGIDAVQLL